VRVDYQEEKRLAVVMYGGVSLAIYIGGVARELLGVVRATAPSAGDPGAGVSQLSKVEEIYRKIASKKDPVSNEEVLKTRVTVDVISGTSAGGINGIFLAKALANGLSMDPILELWKKEGDLAKLLNDAESVKDTALAPDDPPAALLNGRRMYAKLVEAFDAMDGKRDAESWDAARVDLFVTATDIRGEVIRLPVANAVAREKRHRQRFHFTARGPGDNELGNQENPLLAFAARCTSSFPAAFEPFTWNDAAAIAKARAGAVDWTERLLFVGADYQQRPFGDGGYLDNKPFSYAIDELARRQSALKVERTLIYVEPDPEKLLLEKDARLQSQKPDAIENALIALTLSGYETIREDLQRVVERNEGIREVLALEKTVEDALHGRAALKPFTPEEWANVKDITPLIQRYGVTYAAYHKFKLASVVDSIADLVCSAGDVGRPELAQAIHELAEAWIFEAYPSFTDQQQLLLDADLEYRLRKFSFVLRRAPGSGSADLMVARKVLKDACDRIYQLRRMMRQAFAPVLKTLRAGPLTDAALMELESLRGVEHDASLGQLLSKTGPAAEALKMCLATSVRTAVKEISEQVADALPAGASATLALRSAYDAFENFDMVIYPIVRNGEVDEAVPVDIVRISPADLDPGRKPLAGVSLGHFGAFLEEEWRRNDILWGRLDAAETIIRELTKDETPASDAELAAHEQMVKAAVQDAQEAIVQEELRPFLEARLVTLAPPLRQEAMQAIQDKQKLCALFKEGKGFDLGLDRAKQVSNAGRAGIILERILRGWAQKANFPFPRILRWGVLLFAMLGQIAIPRSLRQTVAAYWGRLLALVFLLTAVGGGLTNQNAVMLTGLKGLTVIAVLGLGTLLVSAWIGDTWARRVVRVLSWAAVLAIGALGGWVFRAGWSEVSKVLQINAWVTPFDNFFIGLGAGMLLGAWMQDAWGDLKRIGAWAGRKLGFQ
jgi:patatin-related protein